MTRHHQDPRPQKISRACQGSTDADPSRIKWSQARLSIRCCPSGVLARLMLDPLRIKRG